MSDDANIWAPRNPVATIDNYSTILRERFVAGAAQQVYALTSFAYRVGVNTLQVIRDGLVLESGVDYIETSATSFTVNTPAVGGEVLVVLGFLGSVGVTNDLANLGAQAAPPTVDTLGITLDATHEGYFYWDTSDNAHYTWSGIAWALTANSVATAADAVSVVDAGGKFTPGADAEDALQECATTAEVAASIAAEVTVQPSCRVYNAGSGVNGGLVQYNTEVWDTNSDFDTGTYRFTPTVAGIYQVNIATVVVASGSGAVTVEARKNGAIVSGSTTMVINTETAALKPLTTLIECNGTTDYIDVNVTTSVNIVRSANVTQAYMEIHRVRALP